MALFSIRRLAPTTIRRAASASFVCALLAVVQQPAFGQQTTAPDQDTRQFFRGLKLPARAALHDDLQRNFHSARAATDAAVIPVNNLYRAAFADILNRPQLLVRFSPPDRDIIWNLPAHSDARFMQSADRLIVAACRGVKPRSLARPMALSAAVSRYTRARQQIDAGLDRHYARVMASLSDSGQALVQEQLTSLEAGDSLVYSDLDLGTLSFSQPGFVAAFLTDTCRNAGRSKMLAARQQRLLRDELQRSLNNDAVQMFSGRNAAPAQGTGGR